MVRSKSGIALKLGSTIEATLLDDNLASLQDVWRDGFKVEEGLKEGLDEGVNPGGQFAVPFLPKVFVKGEKGRVEDFAPQEVGSCSMTYILKRRGQVWRLVTLEWSLLAA